MNVRKLLDVPSWVPAPGVEGRVVLSGDRMMFVLFEMKEGSTIPNHKHSNEQMGLCLKGKAILKCDGGEQIIEERSTYRFKPYEEHAVKTLEESSFLDVFAPPRKDYLEKQKQQTS